MAFSPVLELNELSTDPQVTANDYIIDVNHPSMGPVRMTGMPVSFSGTPSGVRYCAPGFGQHTEEVLMDVLGFDWDGIAKLQEEEVI